MTSDTCHVNISLKIPTWPPLGQLHWPWDSKVIIHCVCYAYIVNSMIQCGGDQVLQIQLPKTWVNKLCMDPAKLWRLGLENVNKVIDSLNWKTWNGHLNSTLCQPTTVVPPDSCIRQTTRKLKCGLCWPLLDGSYYSHFLLRSGSKISKIRKQK